MGLIRAAVGAIGSTLHDQWKEAIRCEDLGNEILMKKVSTPTNVISAGSTIIVQPGQCAIIVDNGKVIDATAEEGVYKFDESSTPSFFAGQFKNTFKEMFARFTYNGQSAKEQYVLFFNIKEIINNKFGTATPVPFQDWSHPVMLLTGTVAPYSVRIRCYGTYTFKVSDFGLFMNRLAGTRDEYRRDDIIKQMQSEVMAALQNVLNELGTSKYKVPVLELPSQTDEIMHVLSERVFDQPIRDRGLQLLSFAIESVSLDEDSQKKIDNYEMASNSQLQQGKIASSYANALEKAAENANGATAGFMGLGMMNNFTGGMPVQPTQPTQAVQYDPYQTQPQAQQQSPVQEQPQATTAPVQTAETPVANTENTVANAESTVAPVAEQPVVDTVVSTPAPEGVNAQVSAKKFCTECGKEVPVEAKFCPFCGNKLN